MKLRPVSIHPNALVWRISEGAPLGEWVKKDAPVRRKEPPAPLEEQGSWVRSSFDLLNGTDVIEDDDTIPGELFDELFGPQHQRSSK